MNVLIKLSILVVIQQILSVFKLNVTRWIIKSQFTKGELSLFKWYSWNFISALNVGKVLGLIIIASFTLITFPLGIWIASYKLGISYPIMNIMGAGINMITFPINILIMNRAIQEMAINKYTITGMGLVEISKIIIIIGCWFLYLGNLER